MRRKLAEAAEKRIAEQQSRGLKDAEAARRHQQRVSEIERREREAAKAGTSEPTLKVKKKTTTISELYGDTSVEIFT